MEVIAKIQHRIIPQTRRAQHHKPSSNRQSQGAIQLSAKAGRFVALEALSIRVHDVDFDADPVKLFIRGDEGHCFVYRADEYKDRTRRVSGSDKEK